MPDHAVFHPSHGEQHIPEPFAAHLPADALEEVGHPVCGPAGFPHLLAGHVGHGLHALDGGDVGPQQAQNALGVALGTVIERRRRLPLGVCIPRGVRHPRHGDFPRRRIRLCKPLCGVLCFGVKVYARCRLRVLCRRFRCKLRHFRRAGILRALQRRHLHRPPSPQLPGAADGAHGRAQQEVIPHLCHIVRGEDGSGAVVQPQRPIRQRVQHIGNDFFKTFTAGVDEPHSGPLACFCLGQLVGHFFHKLVRRTGAVSLGETTEQLLGQNLDGGSLQTREHLLTGCLTLPPSLGGGIAVHTAGHGYHARARCDGVRRRVGQKLRTGVPQIHQELPHLSASLLGGGNVLVGAGLQPIRSSEGIVGGFHRPGLLARRGVLVDVLHLGDLAVGVHRVEYLIVPAFLVHRQLLAGAGVNASFQRLLIEGLVVLHLLDLLVVFTLLHGLLQVAHALHGTASDVGVGGTDTLHSAAGGFVRLFQQLPAAGIIPRAERPDIRQPVRGCLLLFHLWHGRTPAALCSRLLRHGSHYVSAGRFLRTHRRHLYARGGSGCWCCFRRFQRRHFDGWKRGRLGRLLRPSLFHVIQI